MNFKVLEVRDEGTRIDVLAIRMMAETEIQEHYIHAINGYPLDGSSIMVLRLADGRATNDPYEWPSITGDRRTLPQAHDWILKHYDALRDGDVVDVQYILGETPAPKIAERLDPNAYRNSARSAHAEPSQPPASADESTDV